MASVIKASGAARAADGVSFNFDDMGVKANQYLEQVRIEAAKIVEQAKKDAVAIRAKAEEDGKQAALRAVEKVLDEKVTKQMATLLPALRQAVEAIARAKQDWLMHWEKTAVHVAAAIASRVVRREIRHEPKITLTLVKEALEMAAGSPELQIRLHPADHAALGEQVKSLAAELTRVADAKVIADAQITSGGCRVETRFGVIDQQIESQLKRIEEELE